MKKTSSPKTKSGWLFAFATVCGYVMLIFLPGQKATAEMHRQLQQQRDYVLDCQHLDTQIAHLEQELKRTRHFNETWHQSSSSEERLAHVFVEMTEHANHAGTEIMRFEPQAAESLHYLRRVPVELALEGTFAQLSVFLTRLETLDAEFWIERLQVEPVLATPGRLRCELRLLLFAGVPEISD
jgi:Tfp pilus assembly protein PilO